MIPVGPLYRKDRMVSINGSMGRFQHTVLSVCCFSCQLSCIPPRHARSGGALKLSIADLLLQARVWNLQLQQMCLGVLLPPAFVSALQTQSQQHIHLTPPVLGQLQPRLVSPADNCLLRISSVGCPPQQLRQPPLPLFPKLMKTSHAWQRD